VTETEFRRWDWFWRCVPCLDPLPLDLLWVCDWLYRRAAPGGAPSPLPSDL